MFTAERPYVLTIAGFDPSSGAGLTADIKTFEAYEVYGLSVCTAITYQNEDTFDSVDWLSFEQITKQVDILFEKYPIEWVKIGLIEDLSVLDALIDYLHKKNRGIHIIWDPILKASAGFTFHQENDEALIAGICKKISLLMPNLEEASFLTPKNGSVKDLATFCSVYVKGGHDPLYANDELYLKDGTFHVLTGEKATDLDKHGTGCVISAALLAALAQGNDFLTACYHAKKYIGQFIRSNKTLLGYHT